MPLFVLSSLYLAGNAVMYFGRQLSLVCVLEADNRLMESLQTSLRDVAMQQTGSKRLLLMLLLQQPPTSMYSCSISVHEQYRTKDCQSACPLPVGPVLLICLTGNLVADIHPTCSWTCGRVQTL